MLTSAVLQHHPGQAHEVAERGGQREGGEGGVQAPQAPALRTDKETDGQVQCSLRGAAKPLLVLATARESPGRGEAARDAHFGNGKHSTAARTRTAQKASEYP